MIQISRDEAKRLIALGKGTALLDMWGIEHLLIDSHDLLIADDKQEVLPKKDDPDALPIVDYA